MRFRVSISPNQRTAQECAKVVLSGPASHSTQLYIDFTTLLGRVRTPSEAVLDFLLTASIVYALDKLVLRSSGNDGWSRLFQAVIPVRQATRWNRLKSTVNSCLEFLTGDEWRVSFTQRRHSLVRRKNRKRATTLRLPLAQGSAVCLFSGGLDSLVGAIDWLEAHPNDSLVLVGHHDPSIAGPFTDQKKLLEILRPHYRSRLSPVLVGIGQSPNGPEISTRSRSLVFIALGTLVANTLGADVPVLIPENGTIALNAPLTPSRRGSCSTRTAHPYYLKQLHEWLEGIGLNHKLDNPLLGKTKGEVVAECRNPALLRAAAPLTVSCAKRGRKQTWIDRRAKSCGRCMPCIYRRAALHKIGLDNQLYGVDVCQNGVDLDDRKSESADDFRACISFLLRNPSTIAIAKLMIANGPIPALEAMHHAATVQRAMEEIRTLLKEKATPGVQKAAGVA